MAKGITIQQPHASDIISGKKPFEGRRFFINPGRLYIHAGLKVHHHYPDLDKTAYPFGAIIGHVEVVEAKRLTADEFRALYEFPVEVSENAPCYQWILTNPVSIEPIPFRGRQSIFEIPEELVS